MNIPNNGRIVIVDNKIEDAEPLIIELSKHGHPISYFSGDVNGLPEKPLEGIRILFLDMDLIDDEDTVGKKNMIMSKMKAVLKRIIRDDNGPIIPIAWTNQPELIQELQEYFHSREFYFPVLKWEKKDFLKVGVGGYDINLIYKKLKDDLKGKESLEVFMLWENLVHSASGITIDEFSKFYRMNDNWNYKTASTFLKLAKGYAGNQINGSSIEQITENSMFSLNSVLGDQVNKQIREHSKTLSPKLPYETINENITSHKIDAKINSNLLMINGINESDLPGSIYMDLDIQKPALEDVFKNIEPSQKEKLKEKTRHIFLEVTPACDYAQDNRKVSRILPGFLSPKEFTEQISKTAEYLYITKDLLIEDSIHVMLFDFRFLTSINTSQLPSKEVKFMIQSEHLADIQSRLASHVSRLGVVGIDQPPTAKKQISLEKEICKSASTIFKHMTNPQKMKQWIKSDVQIESKNCGLVKFSLKKIHFTGLGNDKLVEGTITEFIQNKIISFTCPIKGGTQQSEVTWEMIPLSPRKTLVKFSHSGFGKDDGNEKQILNNIWKKMLEDFNSTV